MHPPLFLLSTAQQQQAYATALQPITPALQAQAFEEAKQGLLQAIEAHTETEPAVAAALGHQLAHLLLHHSAEPERAVGVWQHLCQDHPKTPELWASLGQAHWARGHTPQALAALKQALELNEDCLEAYSVLAPFLAQQGFAEEAASAYQAWHRLAPEALTPLLRLAELYREAQAFEEALEALNKAVVVAPQEALLYFLKGATLQALNQAPAAEEAFTQALALGEANPQLHQAMAHYFEQQHEPHKALHHLVAWVQALQAQQSPPTEPLQALANLLQTLHRNEEALAVLEQLHTLQPQNPQLWQQQAHLLGNQGHVAQAVAAYHQALALGAPPALELMKTLTLPVVLPHAAAAEGALHQLLLSLKALGKYPPQLTEPLAQLEGTPLFAQHWADNPQTDAELATALSHVLQQAMPAAATAPSATPPAAGEPLQLVIISRNLATGNPVERLFGELLKGLPSDAFQRHWVLLGTEPQGGVPLPPNEGVTWLASGQSWSQTTHTLHALAPHVVLFTDVGLEPMSTLLAQHRWAPLQVALCGKPTPTGSPAIDAYLSSTEWETPATEALPPLAETTVALPCLPLAPKLPLHRNTTLVREDFGLSETAPLLLLPQAPYKLHPHMDAWLNEVLNALLSQEPHTRLVVPQAAEPAWTHALKERWQHTLSPLALAAVHWVQPLRPPDWQQLVALSDVVLDSWPCSDLSAAVEALGLGTPVLALQGRSLKNNQVAGIYKALGLQQEGFIATSPAAWVQQALAYLQQPKAQRLAQQHRLQQSLLPLFSHAQHTAASQTLAKALQHLWQGALTNIAS